MTDSSPDVDLVRMLIDTEACIGGGQCEMLEPEVFEVDDDAISRLLTDGRVGRARALELVDRCPGRALSIVEIG